MKMQKDTVLVIGAGMGGLAAAIRLAAAGRDVTLLEAQGWPGGKMRTLPSPAGPVDAGPTVLTLRDVLDDLFQTAGAELDSHITLKALPLLARHFWADGTQLDLYPDAAANAHAIGAAFGTQARDEFTRFERETGALFAAFEAPIMRSARPRMGAAARAMLARPALLPWLAPGRSLSAMLEARFTQPRLRQLFGRYATYVGGNPTLAPAILGLIWQAEAAGVWAVQGGMAALAQALARVFTALGGDLRLNTPVARILTNGGHIAGVQLGCGAILPAAQIIFNGDPAALPFLLDTPRRAPQRHQTQPRSLSANVWTFAPRATRRAGPTGAGLSQCVLCR
jgi:1-hydroxycarotenoid 3,4-desaturase